MKKSKGKDVKMTNTFIDQEIIPTRKLFYRDSFGIYGAIPADSNNHPFKLNEYGNFTIKGKFQELTLDVPYKVKLEEVNDKKYGLGYNVHEIYREIPKTKEDQKNFLYSILTELQVDEIYKAFPDEDVIELFKSDTLDYTKVKGIGKVVYEKIRKKVLDTVEWQDLFAELGRYGIKFETLKKLVEKFGTSENAIGKVKENPYLLTTISGIGFVKADKIAHKMGIKEDSPFRIQAAIRHVIGEEEGSGHTYVMRKALIEKTVELLAIKQDIIEPEIDKTDGLYILEDRIALHRTYISEQEVARMLIDRHLNPLVIDFDLDKFLDEQEFSLGIRLTEQQRNFFWDVINHNVVFLIGSAGTGKSQMQKILIRLIKKLNEMNINVSIVQEDEEINHKYTYKLLAPTGRAAKVLSQYVDGEEASTIHRAIGYGRRANDPDDEEERARSELSNDLILNDEAGMIGIKLVNALLKKTVNEHAKIIFIGDSMQIASIDCGNFLKDCIDSGVFPVTILDKVFRQGEGGILDIATSTRKGEKFIEDSFIGEKKFGSDTILRSVDTMHMEKGYLHYYNIFLKMYKPEDIMVLSYTRKGKLGTVMINKNIQEIVNPQTYKEELSFDEWGTETNNKVSTKKEIKYHDDCIFRVDDYVMNTKNTYEIRDINGSMIDIMNGESGFIVDIVREDDLKDEIEEYKRKKKEREALIFEESNEEVEADEIGFEHRIGIHVKFDDATIAIPFENMDQIMHSWALTNHRSQGGNCKAGIVIVDKSHKFISNANVVYVGITRCKEKMVLLCQADSLNFVLKKFENMSRRTFLKEMLVSYSTRRLQIEG